TWTATRIGRSRAFGHQDEQIATGAPACDDDHADSQIIVGRLSLTVWPERRLEKDMRKTAIMHLIASPIDRPRHQTIEHRCRIYLGFVASFFALSLFPAGIFPARAQGEQPTPLEPGKSIEREMSGGQSHSYRIALTAGQYLMAIADQKGV